MEKIKIREFQRSFCKIKGSACEVLDADGAMIGTWLPVTNGLSMRVGHGLVSVRQDCEPKAAENGLDNTVGQLCEKCECSRAEYMIWEDGVDRLVCLQCIKRSMPANVVKGFLRKAIKI